MTEDHPLDYGTFEGIIPKGEYGGGQVIVWDAGIYAPEERGRPCFDRQRAEEIVRQGIKQGKLTVFLNGRKLRGGWTLVHTQEKNWLFLKKDDSFADGHDPLGDDASVLSGLTIADLKAGRLPEQRRTSSCCRQGARMNGTGSPVFLNVGASNWPLVRWKASRRRSRSDST